MDGALTIEGYREEPPNLPALRADTPVLIDPATHFLPVPWELIEQGAELVASCPGLSPKFADPKNCRFISYQAARWRMDPIAVASKTYFTDRKGGGLLVGYEAQLIMALINSDPAMVEPLDFAYGYAGGPPKKQASHRYCKAIGYLRGIARPRVVTSPTFAQIKVKNSPLWFSDVDQQFAYYTGRTWARRHRPGRLLGVYAKEEIELFQDADSDVYQARRPMFEEDIPSIESGFDTVPPAEGAPAASGPGDAPHTDTTEPDGMAEVRAWVDGERARLVALTDPAAIATQATATVKDARFRKLIAYDQPKANAFDKSIKNRIEELNS